MCPNSQNLSMTSSGNNEQVTHVQLSCSHSFPNHTQSPVFQHHVQLSGSHSKPNLHTNYPSFKLTNAFKFNSEFYLSRESRLVSNRH